MLPLIKNIYADLGYNLVALPKTGIEPLLLLCKDGQNLRALGSPLEALFEPDVQPVPNCNSTIAQISGEKKLEFDLKANMDFLSAVFQAVGLKDSGLKAEAATNNHYKVRFSFDAVREDAVGHIDLDNFLTGAIPLENEFRTYIEHLKRSELYVVTNVLKSNTFTIEVSGENGRHLDFDADLKETAQAKLDIQRNQNNTYTIAHREGPQLAFAFKAAQIIYDKSAWLEFWKRKEAGFTIKDQQGLVLLGEEDFPVRLLNAEDQLIDL